MAEALFNPSIVTEKFTLNNGSEMPIVGMGTFRIREQDEIMEVVNSALTAGYRLFDTAAVYRNETHLGEAFRTLLPQHDLTRDDIFVTTKLSPSDHGRPEGVKRAYHISMQNLGLEYADLYLIHFPGTRQVPNHDKNNTELRLQTWEGMVQLYDEGSVNAIGVSNFTIYHLKQLMERNHGIVPAVNQVEWHPFYYQTELRDYCKANEIQMQAYCSFGGKSVDNNELLLHPAVTKIAEKYDCSNAQVLLKWALQQDIAVIPKSTNAAHMKDNLALNFYLAADDMRTLFNLPGHRVKYAWDPSVVV